MATFGAALHGYRAAMAELESIFDQELISFSHALVHLPATDTSISQHKKAPFVFQVWQDNRLLIRSNNSPVQRLSEQVNGFSDKNFLGARWRVYSQQVEQRQVYVAQRQSQRLDSAERVLLTSILPIVIAIPFIGLFVLLAVRRSLAPLRQLSRQLSVKSSDDLASVQITENSKELEPIVEVINSVFARLKSAFTREKRLASDAAHELRTPISVLNIDAHNLTKGFQSQSLQVQDFDKLSQSVERMAHVVEQILALNRSLPESFNKKLQPIDIEKILQTVIAKLYPRIEAQQQVVSLQSKPYKVKGDEFSLQTLFENLLVNANKYAGKGCEIKVSVSETIDGVIVVVEDSGIGIPEPDRDKAFDRFYRFDHQHQSGNIAGCGLGMSIVKHIVDLHQGDIHLSQSSLGGLKVSVSLPSADKEAQC